MPGTVEGKTVMQKVNLARFPDGCLDPKLRAVTPTVKLITAKSHVLRAVFDQRCMTKENWQQVGKNGRAAIHCWAKRYLGRTTTWAITLAAPPDKDAFPIRYGRDGEEAAIWVRRALPRQAVILHTPAKGDGGSYNFSEEQIPVIKELVTEKKTTTTKQEAADVTMGDDGTAAKQEEGGEAAPPPMKKREVEKRVLPEGLTMKKVASDGNCVVAAFALAHADAVTRIGKRTVKPLHPRQTRAALVSYMMANASTFEGGTARASQARTLRATSSNRRRSRSPARRWAGWSTMRLRDSTRRTLPSSRSAPTCRCAATERPARHRPRGFRRRGQALHLLRRQRHDRRQLLGQRIPEGLPPDLRAQRHWQDSRHQRRGHQGHEDQMEASGRSKIREHLQVEPDGSGCEEQSDEQSKAERKGE